MIVHKIDETVMFISQIELIEFVAGGAPDSGYLRRLQQDRDYLLGSTRTPDSTRCINLLDMRIAQICEFMGSSIYDA